jgi:hypothetical protein
MTELDDWDGDQLKTVIAVRYAESDNDACRLLAARDRRRFRNGLDQLRAENAKLLQQCANGAARLEAVERAVTLFAEGSSSPVMNGLLTTLRAAIATPSAQESKGAPGHTDLMVPPETIDASLEHCCRAPPGWLCSRAAGHSGPCAASECETCAGSGWDGHECGDDTCCCVLPEENVPCETCGGWPTPSDNATKGEE